MILPIFTTNPYTFMSYWDFWLDGVKLSISWKPEVKSSTKVSVFANDTEDSMAKIMKATIIQDFERINRVVPDDLDEQIRECFEHVKREENANS